MADELVDIVNDSGDVISQSLKSVAHEQGLLHKTVIGYLKYGSDWALVSQASDKQDAGQLVAAVGGHVTAGESDEDALLRESEEEIGTRNITFKHIGNAIYHRQVIGRDENHLFVVYEIRTDDPIVLNKESDAIERFNVEEFKEALRSQPEHFGDPLFFNLENFFAEHLPAGYNKRWT